MGLFDVFKRKSAKIKEPADQLALLGADEARSNEFLEALSRSKIWILGEASESKTVVSENGSQDRLIQEAKEHIRDAAGIKSTDDVRVHTAIVGEYKVLPFFSSQNFIAKYVENSRIEKVAFFAGFESDPVILLREDLWRLPAIMNLGSEHPRLFAAEDKVALAKLLSARTG
jgi:hypothetical protein